MDRRDFCCRKTVPDVGNRCGYCCCCLGSAAAGEEEEGVLRSKVGLRQCVKLLGFPPENGDIGRDCGLSSNPGGSFLIGGVSEYALLEYVLLEECGKDKDLS